MVHRGQGVQIIYGPGVTVIKANLEDYLEHAPKELYEPQKEQKVLVRTYQKMIK